MAAKSKKQTVSLENRNTVAKVLTNPMVLVLLITAGGVVLAGKFWADYRKSLQGDARFSVSIQQVVLTPKPAWVQSDLQQAFFSKFQWEGRSLLDENLVVDIAEHVQRQPWVEKVLKVQKAINGVQVKVVYRQPVAMVELPPDFLMPVDRNGVVLDSREFTMEQSDKFLRISIRDLPKSDLLLGQAWPDGRVPDAAVLAGVLQANAWQSQVRGIYGFSRPVVNGPMAGDSLNATQDRAALDTEFLLSTVNRNEIIWGHAIGKETSGEAPAAEKIAGLRTFLQQNGPIDQWHQLPTSSGNVLDLRTGKLVLLKTSLTARNIPGRY